MKKILAIILVGIMVFALAACGGDSAGTSAPEDKNNEQGTIDAQEVADKALEEAEELDSFSVEAVEYYLKQVLGMSLVDIEPAWEYTVGEYMAYADEPSSGYGHAAIIFTKADGEVTGDEYNAWLQKVFAATAGISQDGYNIIGYEFVSEGEDALAETTLEDAIGGFMTGWAFRYNDQIMVVYVEQEYDNDKESEIGELLYYDGVSFDVGTGLQKSWDDTMSELEDYMEENEDEIKDAIEDYLN